MKVLNICAKVDSITKSNKYQWNKWSKTKYEEDF